ncbi:LuxR C-terminal-related transcriptional regulator [Cupriavidus pinatubonensis]|uniref:LuxR C-terminal-related transcriptional regulator n=1 Tax=Cupriavidus pinatubonensis TaxID=248026 RepID=UPI00112AD7DF|nr:LuxR C-terminal-related transcriptional regulator [Cupriavidus pinatubonensis]TPQ44330.1 helix-turn-helix transcriptional regulator [Cupriavidus pinatubonensis]
MHKGVEDIPLPARPPSRGLVASKLVPPASGPATLPRPQLVQGMLDASAARLILIRAAAGFGKTTLMQQYAVQCAARQRSTAWLRVDGGDNDLERFLVHLDAGLQALHGKRKAARGTAPADDTTGPRLAHRIIEQVASAVLPFSILLDDFETVQSASVLNFVQQLVEAMPPCGTLVIASRVTPEIGLGRIRARGHLLEIHPAQLRFTLEEATALIRERCHLPLRDSEIATLHRCTEGWATAIYLATLSLQTRTDPAAFVASFSGTNLELAEYLAEDILAQQSDACRSFLLETSVLGQLSASLCDAVTGRQDSRAMIDYLERANLLLFPLDGDRTWYRYHQLFASFLQHRLDLQQPGRATELHRDAARWYLEQSRPVPAVDHLLQAGLHDEALPQIARQADALLSAGRVRLLVRWLDPIRPEALARHPRLRLARAWALLLNRRYADALQAVESIQALGDSGGSERLAVEAETIRCVLLVMTDQVEACRQASMVQINRLGPDDLFQYCILANSLAYSLICTHRYDDARSVLSRAIQRGADERSVFMRSIADCLEGLIDLVHGRLGNALARFHTASTRTWNDASGDITGDKPAIDTSWSLALYENDALDEMARLLADALPYTKANGPPDSVIGCHVLSARLALLRGDKEQWLRVLAELEQLGQQVNAERSVCSAWIERARVATLEGRLDAAEQALRAVDLYGGWEARDTAGHANDIERPSITRRRLEIAQGQHAVALAALDEAIGAAIAHQRFWRLLKLRILRATALDGLARRDEALQEITEALRLASHEGFVRTFLDEGERIAMLVRSWASAYQTQAAGLGIAPQFVTRLLAKLPGAPVATEAEPALVAGLSDSLTARELEVLQMLSAGLRNRAIAEKLFLSELTVKSHLRKINAKLGAQNRTEAVAIGRSRGLIP